MATKKTISPRKQTSSRSRRSPAKAIEVKRPYEVIKTFNNFIFKNFHDRYNAHFSEETQQKLVSYGPWLMIGVLILLAPELLVLANNNMFISPTGFIEKILFNKDSWVTLIIVFVNIICAVDALSELFNKTIRGWRRVYVALLVNLSYVLYQLFSHLDQPAAPLLSIVGFGLCLFAILDIRSYYK